jgi:signal transduction histidine kinase
MVSQFEEISRDGKTYFKIPPNAARMVRGMGRLSYKFEQAIADLIDNSIAAGATKIDVHLDQRIGGRIYIHVLDNGSGIAKDYLPSAIQYG